MVPLLLIAVVVVLVTLSQVVDVRRQYEVRTLMDGVLTHRGQATLDEIALMVREQKHYLGRHMAEAYSHRSRGRRTQALASLSLGCEAIEALAPDFLTALCTLRRLSRCVSAVVVIEPVSMGSFRSPSLKGLAGIGSLLHYLLLTGRQRVELRLHIVASAFRLGVRWLRNTRDRIATRDRAALWQRVDRLVSDLGASGDAALAATRQIAEALDAVEFGRVIARGARS